jgi:opacity protein-like surface antigen
MKKSVKLSIISIVSIMNMAYAGGDISPVTPYETNDIMEADMEAVEEEVTVVEPEPIGRVEEYSPPVVEEPESTTTTVVVPPIPIKHESEPVKEPVVVNTPLPPKNPPAQVKENSSTSGVYVGVGGVVSRYDSNCPCTDTVTDGGVMARAGYDINKYIGIEGRTMTTSLIGSSSADTTHYGVYIKPMLPIGDKAKVYALVGAGKSKTTGSVRHSDVEGLSWGVGANYDITNHVSAFVDYTRLINKSDSNAPKLDSVSVGVNYNL